jgi:hypothetical protein
MPGHVHPRYASHRRQDRLYGIEKMNAYCMEVKIFPSH